MIIPVGDITVITAVAILLGKELLSWYQSSGRNQLKNFNKNVKLDTEVKKELKTLVDVIGANRCSVIKYHNGQESFDGFSFNFASMTHEQVDDITVEIIDKFQKVPLSSFAESLDNLIRTEEKWLCVDSGDTHSGIMQAGWNIQRSYNFMLSNKLSDGILCVAFTQSKPEFTKAQLLLCKATAYKINVLLSQKKKKPFWIV